MNKKFLTTPFKNIAIASVIAIFFIADRLLKMIGLQIVGLEPLTLIREVLYFNLTKNYYIAFSLPLSGAWLELVITLVIIIIIFYLSYLLLYKKNKKIEIISLSLIFLGAASNLFDRLHYGYVIDYLELKYFTVFNLADCLISIGALILIIKNLKTSK
ncbi:MAG: signal peptidase II [Patescibacteria group bacterium]